MRHRFLSWTDTRGNYPPETRSVLDGVEDAFHKIERGEVLRSVVTF
jgi:Zn-dependent alcohol dehydrogenase